MSGRKTKTHCHIRLMNAHDGIERDAGRVPVRDDVERRHERHEGDEEGCARAGPRGSAGTSPTGTRRSESIHATLPRTPFARSRRLDGVESSSSTAGASAASHLGQRHDVVVDGLDGAADDDLVSIAGLRHRAHHAGDRLDIGLGRPRMRRRAGICSLVAQWVRLSMLPGPPTLSTMSAAVVEAMGHLPIRFFALQPRRRLSCHPRAEQPWSRNLQSSPRRSALVNRCGAITAHKIIARQGPSPRIWRPKGTIRCDGAR